jgi:hypothetical protein
VPQTTCHLEPYCVTHKVCRQVPVCVPVCPPACVPPPLPSSSNWKPTLSNQLAQILRKENEAGLIKTSAIK